MGQFSSKRMRALLACAVVASAFAVEQGAGGLNISSLTVGVPAGHSAKLELTDTAQTWSFGAFNDGVRQWKLVKQEQFDVSAEGWSNTSTTACGGYQMLGGYRMFAGGEVKKTFENLPAHKMLRVVANFHFIDAWTGEYAYSRVDDNYVWTDTYSHEASAGSDQFMYNF